MSHCEDCGGELMIAGTAGFRSEVKYVCLLCGGVDYGPPGTHGLGSEDEYELAVLAECQHAPVVTEEL